MKKSFGDCLFGDTYNLDCYIGTNPKIEDPYLKCIFEKAHFYSSLVNWGGDIFNAASEKCDPKEDVN